MLEKNQFVVKEHAKMFSSKKTYDILDADSGQPLGVAQQKTGAMAAIIGMVLGPPATAIEVREKPGDTLAFSVRRRGLLFKKVEAVDAQGNVIGTYKTKKFSLSGGFHVYGSGGKHFCEIRGKLLKAEYTFFTPDGKTEMAKVSKKWGGAARELFSSADTYRVEVKPEVAGDPVSKMLILGAAIAADALFGGTGGKSSGGDDGGDE